MERLHSETMFKYGITVLLDSQVTPDDFSPVSNNYEYENEDVTYLQDGVIVKPNSVIYRGAKLGNSVEVCEQTRIGARTIVGNGTKVVYGAKLYDDVVIGEKSIIAGFCCNGSKVGSYTTMMGHLLHKYPTHAIDTWDDEEGEDEPSPEIGNTVIIGYNALIIGGIKIGNNSYIAAGATICKNVPQNTKVIPRVNLQYKPRN